MEDDDDLEVDAGTHVATDEVPCSAFPVRRDHPRIQRSSPAAKRNSCMGSMQIPYRTWQIFLVVHG